MKILIVHNRYTRTGGEERVVSLQRSVFEKMGHEVVMYEKSNTEDTTLFSKIALFFTGFYNFRSRRDVKAILKANDVDFCIVHNLYHKITPSVLTALKKAFVPTVAVQHNYRLLCPVATMYRDGAVCSECMECKSREFRCVRHNCADNTGNSVFYALRSMFVRKMGFFKKDVDRLVALTGFQKGLLAVNGFDGTKIAVIPNSTNVPSVLPAAVKKGYIGFAGRLTHEKGIDIFLDMALRMPEKRFRIAGENTLPSAIILPSNVEFCGFLEGDELWEFYSSADFIMLASRWYEGFPMVILEAFACGTAVLVPDIGALPEIVSDGTDGLIYELNDLNALICRLKTANPVEMGIKGYQKVKDEYDMNLYYNRFMELYDKIKNNEYEK